LLGWRRPCPCLALQPLYLGLTRWQRDLLVVVLVLMVLMLVLVLVIVLFILLLVVLLVVLA
jgi:heme/copper-type cytochrome/quinol oxidase subunit 2